MKFTTWEDFNPDEHKNTTIVIADGLSLSDKLRIKRQVEKLKQPELASILGFGDASVICKIENEKKSIENMSYERVERIKQYLYEEDYSNGELVE